MIISENELQMIKLNKVGVDSICIGTPNRIIEKNISDTKWLCQKYDITISDISIKELMSKKK